MAHKNARTACEKIGNSKPFSRQGCENFTQESKINIK